MITSTMQVWQLFSLIPAYCEITGDNASLYCNMVKFLLRLGKIHGEQAIVSLKDVPSFEMKDYFRNSCFSTHNVERFHQVMQNIVEYEMGASPTHVEEVSHRITRRNARTIELGISLVVGFVFGCFYTSFHKK